MCGTRIARLIQNKVSEDGNGARQFAPPYGAEQEQCKTKSWRTGEDSFLQHRLIVISKLSLYSEAYEYQIWLFITRLASLPPRFYFTTKLCLLNLEAYPCHNNQKKIQNLMSLCIIKLGCSILRINLNKPHRERESHIINHL